MEVKIKKVINGYTVEVTGECEGEYFEKEYVFTRYSHVQKFVKEFLSDDAKSN